MKLNIYTKGRDNQYFAEGEYKDGKVIVYAGAKINKFRATNQVPEYIKKARFDENLVNENGYLLANISFTSASHAALFVTGNISNGLRVWKTEDGKYLRETVKESKGE